MSWLTRVLDFANADELPERLSTRASTALRKQLDLGRHSHYYLPSGALVVVGGVRWKPEEPREAQRRLIATLATLATHGVQASLCTRLAQTIAGLKPGGVARFVSASSMDDAPLPPRAIGLSQTCDYRFDNYVVLKPSSLDEWAAITVAELISQGFGGRVRRCDLPSCRAFFVNLIRRGPPAMFCSESHGSQARVARQRARERKER